MDPASSPTMSGSRSRGSVTGDAMKRGNTTMTQEVQMLKARAEHAWILFKQRWESFPFLYKTIAATVITLLVLGLFLVFLFAHATAEAKDHVEAWKYHPQLIHSLLNVSQIWVGEADAAVAYVQSRSAAAYNALLEAQRETDMAMKETMNFYDANSNILNPDTLETDADSENTDGHNTFLTVFGAAIAQHSLMTIRSKIYPVVHYHPHDLADAYAGLQYDLTQYTLSLACELGARGAMRTSLVAMAAAAAAIHISEAHRIGMNMLQGNVYGTKAEKIAATLAYDSHDAAVGFWIERFMTTCLLDDEVGRFRLSDAISKSELRSNSDLRHEMREKLAFLPPTASAAALLATARANASESKKAIQLVFRSMAAAEVQDLVQGQAGNVVRYAVVLGICCATIVIALLKMLHYQQTMSQRNAIQTRNSMIMVEVILRVCEYIENFATFALNVLPPPRGMQGTFVGAVELQLARCLASLKVMEATVPPLLFPQKLPRSRKFVEYANRPSYEQMKHYRDFLDPQRVKLLSASNYLKNPYVADIEQLTANHLEIVDASIVTVDLSSLFTLSQHKHSLALEESFTKLIKAIEETIVLLNGVFHLLYADRAVGVWNVGEEQPNHCECAAQAAHDLAARLLTFRQSSAMMLLPHLCVRIGLSRGPVHFGIFGDTTIKSVQLFGPALVRGMLVARANQMHATAVACDDNVRRIIEKQYSCKPIEIITDSDGKEIVVYEVFSHVHRKEIQDLETKLIVYKAAFALYEKKYYREALKAFRAYTKQYGYDGSVERIQNLITGS